MFYALWSKDRWRIAVGLFICLNVSLSVSSLTSPATFDVDQFKETFTGYMSVLLWAQDPVMSRAWT